MLNVQCPSCNKVHQAPESMMGQQVQCKDCGATFTVPHSAPPAVAAPKATLGGGRAKADGGGLAAVAKILLVVGLVAIAFCRGCDGVLAQQEGYTSAKLENAQTEFNQEWGDKIDAETDSQRRSDLMRQRDEERDRLSRGEWKDLQRAAANAKTQAVIWRYRFEWLFMIGSVILAAGAGLLALCGSKVDRVVSLIIVGIIVFSLLGGLGFVFQARR